MKKTKTIREDQRIFDADVSSGFPGILEITIYEVKNENRKHFGRRKFFDFSHSTIFIDDFDTIDDAILHTLNKGFAKENCENSRREKWEAFEKGE